MNLSHALMLTVECNFLTYLVKPFKWKDGWKMQISSEKKIYEILAFFYCTCNARVFRRMLFYDDKIKVESHWVTCESIH